MISFKMNDHNKIGLGLTGFGVFFSFLGVIFFFDKGLLAMGNLIVDLMPAACRTLGYVVILDQILFISRVTLTIGLKSSMQFFTKRSNSSGFWLTLAVFVQKIPVLGWVFQQPFVRSPVE
ncbi:hypothetical protein RHSIM_Rhsim04G0067300 [Rhododendron simsii]|uniref:Uncharacterized protein n=1 Tax=Rhododendron simsii TaxID=118357 RepID=A0A834H3Y5_RHOSS|nr:hypothetical protein RHSIM_Rhsim04G0067300 [Rhododendron simsii]